MLAFPAWGAEVLAFSDVEPGSWYEEGVRVCVEAGLMEGVGDGRFAPEEALSYEELIVLSARLHHILTGGDGVLPPAPGQYRTAELTFADGSPAPFQMDECTGRFGKGAENAAYFRFPEELAEAYVGRVFTLTLHLEETRSYAGTMERFPRNHPTLELYDYELRVPFETWEETRALSDQEWMTRIGPLPAWCADAVYYADREGLFEVESEAMGTPATRTRFAKLLNGCLSDEEAVPINQITQTPDLSLNDAGPSPLRLYNAGILTGADPYGTFYGNRGLSRAEAAVMLARALDPALRVTFVPETPEWYLDYTLERLPDSYAQAVTASEYGYHDAWSDLTAIAEDGALTFLFSNGKPVRDLDPAFPGRVYLQEQYERGDPYLDPLPNALDPHEAGYAAALTAPYVEGVAPFTINQGFAWGYYSQEGNILIPARFSWAGALVDGVSIVQDWDGAYYRLTIQP